MKKWAFPLKKTKKIGHLLSPNLNGMEETIIPFHIFEPHIHPTIAFGDFVEGHQIRP